MDDNDTNLPYRVCYADGDGEDISADEFDRIKTVAIAVLNAIRLQERDKGYWIFPALLADTYSKFSSRYQLDAMEHVDGISSKAPYFCSMANSVFHHNIQGLKIWCNPDFSLIESFIKFFLRAFDKDNSTELTIVLPVWTTRPFWKILESFRLIDYIKTGAEIFQTMDTEGRIRGLGPTRWDIVVLYYGAKFQLHRHFKATRNPMLQPDDVKRIPSIVKLNYMLTGDPVQDMSRLSAIIF